MVYVRIHPRSTRLGNWMFQYAAAKTAHPDEPISFVISEEGYADCVLKYAEVFSGVDVVSAVPEGCEARVGLFQDSKFVNRDVAKSLYRCPARIEHVLKYKFDDLLGDEKLVSIHVRRGDYMKLPHRHPFVGEEYLKEAVARFPSSRFLVCSDDIPWCKRFFSAKRFPGIAFHFAEGTDVLSDLFVMSRCKGGHICSNSSFSWWGAFLGEGKTVFPSLWFGMAIRDDDGHGMYFDGCDVVQNGYTVGRWLLARLLILKTAMGDVLRKVGLR